MVTTQAAASLSEAIEARMRELEEAVAGVSEEAADRRPGDAEWCVKETLSHLIGDPDTPSVDRLRRFLDEDTPLLGIVTGLPYYSPDRQKLPVGDLLSRVRGQYDEVASFVGGLSEEQLARKARIPFLKETPIGEYLTLDQWVGVLAHIHIADHIKQIRAARERIGA